MRDDGGSNGDRAQRRRSRRCVLPRILACLLWPAAAAAADQKPADVANPSGLALPRYASLKYDRVNLRSGPGTEYPAVWVYRKAGLPLEITREFEGWRQVRDSEGAAGWVLQTALSGRRTAIVEPWSVKPGAELPEVALHAESSEKARRIANLQAGVIANVLSCEGTWCWVSVEQWRGYILQSKLWGVYAGEIVK